MKIFSPLQPLVQLQGNPCGHKKQTHHIQEEQEKEEEKKEKDQKRK